MAVPHLAHIVSVVAHSAAEIVLLSLTLHSCSLLQEYGWGPLRQSWPLAQGSQPFFVRWMTESSSPPFLDVQTKHYWRLSSFFVWAGFTFGAPFLLHLPSLWKRRVQLSKAFSALDERWYSQLQRPMWYPRDYFFPLLWIPVKCLRAAAHSIVWEYSKRRFYRPAVMQSVVSTVLADLWNQVFFVQHDFFGALGVLALLILNEVWVIIYLKFEIPGAVPLLLPYIASLVFAVALNLSIVRLNDERPHTKDS